MMILAYRLLSAAVRKLRIARDVHVAMIGPAGDLALVTIRHGLLSRLAYSEPEIEFLVCCVPAIGGGRLWLYDSPQRPVTDLGVIAAIDRERADLDVSRLAISRYYRS